MKQVMIIDENLTVKNEIDWNEWGRVIHSCNWGCKSH